VNKELGVAFILALGTASIVLAQDLPSEPPVISTLPKPVTMTLKDKLQDTAKYNLPKPPSKYVDGTALVLMNDEDQSPRGPALKDLTDIDTLEQIPIVNKANKNSNKYYWHLFKEWDYCHYRDGDRQWYGWYTGDQFHWVLWWSSRFWWYDAYAERWLYYDRGYWWWQSLTKNNQIQVFLDDGHFHVCDTDGVLGDDLMATGVEEEVTGSASPKSTPGAGGKHGGHHHGGGGMGGGSTGGNVGNSYQGDSLNGNP
jgi:hypothetical protein